MPYCTNCGTEIGATYDFCNACGAAVAVSAPVGYPISINRIVGLVILTYGLYLIYWFYLTWRQYKDHTGHEVYPVWHALTLLVPVYGLFRTHAHMRSYNELISKYGLLGGISVGWVVAAVLVSIVLDNAALEITGGFQFEYYTFGAALAAAIIYMVSMMLVIWTLKHVQTNLNRYWSSLENVKFAPSKVRVGEVVFSIIGLLAWSDTISGLLSESYRAA